MCLINTEMLMQLHETKVALRQLHRVLGALWAPKRALRPKGQVLKLLPLHVPFVSLKPALLECFL